MNNYNIEKPFEVTVGPDKSGRGNAGRSNIYTTKTNIYTKMKDFEYK